MSEAKGTRKAAAKKPSVAWTKGFTPWGVPCSKLLVDGRTLACRDSFGTPVPVAQIEKSASSEN